MRSLHDFTSQLKQNAAFQGFVLCGVTHAATPNRIRRFQEWLDSGFAGQMQYLEKNRHAYSHPRYILDGCRSIVMLALPYDATDASQPEVAINDSAAHGRVARYAQGTSDYHDVIHKRLKELKQWILRSHPNASVRGVVDTAPLLEREFAEAAGLGWIGRNTLLLNREWGSYFFLAAILTDLELSADAPNDKGYCGTCTACIDACPTNAFPEPFVLDATKCISYLTIEHRDDIDDDKKSHLNGWIFGCDICQEVCPWNRKQRTPDPTFKAKQEMPALLEILAMSDDDFRSCFRRTPMWRSRRRGLLRNAILVVGSGRLRSAEEALRKLCNDEEPILRSAAAWALAQLESP